MTKTYTYQYKLLPNRWSSPPAPPIDELDDYASTIAYRQEIAPILKDRLDVLHTWRFIIANGYILMLITMILFDCTWTIVLILSVIVSLIYLFIWIKIRHNQRTVAIIEGVIDIVLNQAYGIMLPPILK